MRDCGHGRGVFPGRSTVILVGLDRQGQAFRGTGGKV